MLFGSISLARETASHREEPVIPDERCYASRDPWFDTLTTLSYVEGESRNIEQFQKLLDPGSRPASRGLAGMTHCDTVSKGEGKRRISSWSSLDKSLNSMPSELF